MKSIIDITLIITLLFGGKYALPKLHDVIKREVLSSIARGLPPLGPYSEIMIGKESRF